MATAEKEKKPRRRNKTADMEKRLANLEASIRICQLMIQQLGKTLNSASTDLGDLAEKQRSVQYRLLAVQEILHEKLPGSNVLETAEELQIKDFNEFSDKENVEKGYVPADVVAEDSVVVITSDGEDGKGFTRSKFEYDKIQIPGLKESILGKKTGDKFDAKISEVNHTVTVLQIFKKPEVKEEPEAETK
jgi:seryl-tRNA synthetase